VNRFWLNNLASMHNHRSLFNMDISGGMPSVIIKMLVASDPGNSNFCRAPQSLADRNDRRRPLSWSDRSQTTALVAGGRRMHAALRQSPNVLLELPAAISAITVEGKGGKVAKGASANRRKLTLRPCRI